MLEQRFSGFSRWIFVAVVALALPAEAALLVSSAPADTDAARAEMVDALYVDQGDAPIELVARQRVRPDDGGANIPTPEPGTAIGLAIFGAVGVGFAIWRRRPQG